MQFCMFFLRTDKKKHILKVENEIKQDMKPHHMKVIQMKAYIRYKKDAWSTTLMLFGQPKKKYMYLM